MALTPLSASAATPLSARAALALFVVVIVAWGLQWTVTRAIVAEAPPLWTAAIRTAIAAVALLVLLRVTGQFAVPGRKDLPIVLSIGLLHMVGFAALMTIGLQIAPVGRSIVLGYTTPIWVALGAWLLLREAVTARNLVGAALGLAGLGVLLNPLALDWGDRQALLGSALLLLAAVAWSGSILYIRAHTFGATPFLLTFWQCLLATCVLTVLAVIVEGAPRIRWSAELVGLFAYSGLIGTALAYWAMTMVNRSVSAMTAAIGVLGTPIVGIVSSALFLGERIEPAVVAAAALVFAGIAIGARPARPAAAQAGPQAP